MEDANHLCVATSEMAAERTEETDTAGAAMPASDPVHTEDIPVKTQDLIRHGVDPRLVGIWRSIGVETLFPVQRTAAEDYSLFGGRA